MKNIKNIVIYIIILLAISVVTGFIIGFKKTIDISGYLSVLDKNNNLFFEHIFIFLIIFISTLSLINIVSESIIISIEGISIGYIISIFYRTYSIRGIIFSIINILINKGILLVILLYLFIISFKYANLFVKNLIGINRDYIIFLVKPLLKKFLIIFIIVILNDTFIYFFGNVILNYLSYELL